MSRETTSPTLMGFARDSEVRCAVLNALSCLYVSVKEGRGFAEFAEQLGMVLNLEDCESWNREIHRSYAVELYQLLLTDERSPDATPTATQGERSTNETTDTQP